jgi:NADH pyrophosphatase NudC (nudix superfamily)
MFYTDLTLKKWHDDSKYWINKFRTEIYEDTMPLVLIKQSEPSTELDELVEDLDVFIEWADWFNAFCAQKKENGFPNISKDEWFNLTTVESYTRTAAQLLKDRQFMPKYPIYNEKTQSYCCPKCDYNLITASEYRYCPNCGQMLKSKTN